MILVDTSVWIEYFRQSNSSLSDKLELLIENNEVIALSCVFGELLQGIRNDSEEKTIVTFWQNLTKVDETNLFIEAGKLSAKYKLLTSGVGLIDSSILAAAIKHNLPLWTLDKRLNDSYSKLLLG
ncbi:MAG TPA: PIN domain-containing protein [Cyclobacteriaceae bacterium]|jgi:predicted nucleic acid-binding protein|nr:PIN domain-containing protein [Cyclobacteriaceae bacterium]